MLFEPPYVAPRVFTRYVCYVCMWFHRYSRRLCDRSTLVLLWGKQELSLTRPLDGETSRIIKLGILIFFIGLPTTLVQGTLSSLTILVAIMLHVFERWRGDPINDACPVPNGDEHSATSAAFSDPRSDFPAQSKVMKFGDSRSDVPACPKRG